MGIAWKSWEEGIVLARRSKKPVLLSISARWCHWCHTMDRLTWSNAAVSRLVNKSFVPVRVDADRRPDIDARYNLGGWPTTAILTPSADLVRGATYIPQESINAFLRDGIAQARSFKPQKEASERTAVKAVGLKGVQKEILRDIIANADPANGGFGTAPKFPHPQILLWFAAMLHKHKDASLQTLFLRSLEAMSHGELQDNAGGGFFRYCLNANWTMPHFEKMLWDNAALADVYVSAYELTKHRRWRRVAEGVIRFADEILYSKGMYGGSQEADEEFCRLPLHLREKREPPARDMTVYVDANAQMCSTLLHAARVFRSVELRDRALNILDTLLKDAVTPKGAKHYIGDDAPILLRDTAYLLCALCDAHTATREDRWRSAARKIAASAIKSFAADGGGWQDRIPRKDDAGRLLWQVVPVEENSVFATALLRLDTTASQRAIARTALESIAPQARAYPIGAGMFGLATDLL